MLQVFERGKATALLRSTHTRTPLEDILTAAVFGIIEYVETDTAIEMLKLLLGSVIDKFPQSVASVQSQFWRRSERFDRRGWIEPDILIDLLSAPRHCCLRIIVESKWDALLQQRQAIDQWLRFAGKADRTWHIFPVRHVAAVEQALLIGDDELVDSEQALTATWKLTRRCVSWSDIARGLSKVAETRAVRPHVSRWALGVLSVLRVLGEKPFEGFKYPSAVETGALTAGSRLFWMGSGLHSFNWPEPIHIEPLTGGFFSRRSNLEHRCG